jgi:hypothetical protein
MAEKVNLGTVEKEAFSECYWPRSFYLSRSVGVMGESRLNKCVSLHGLGFASSDSLNRFVGFLMPDEALEQLGLEDILDGFRIEIEVGDCELDFESAEWSFVGGGSCGFALVHDLP